ncbi:MAG: hypothetical protein ACWGQW_08150, partial [bacterium]
IHDWRRKRKPRKKLEVIPKQALKMPIRPSEDAPVLPALIEMMAEADPNLRSTQRNRYVPVPSSDNMLDRVTKL